ncbi:MAG: FAD-dependent oxidoreductase [Sedimentibacter saalensis]|uniref:FAD-dependent oxidoreductase n=1 Tax=Sedimentibacter saalensis TaxID=130788 RepID=UPI002B21F614|nr:FAD-dependent oxidoreductase [Sedimentibacter saalensis]MEA5093870.1 FAD-dependent oxidoreductase [Sedimentibacter saalensis]
MKKNVRGVVIFVITIAFAFLLYSMYEIYLKEQIEDTGEVSESDDQEPHTQIDMVIDYFPVLKDTKYTYITAENDEIYEMTIDYVSEDMMQLRTKYADEVNISVIQVSDNKAMMKLSQEESYFRKNLMNYPGNMEILMMGPIEEGRHWSVNGGGVRTITSTTAMVSTPIEMYSAVEVTTVWDNKRTVEYYAKGVGLVKSIVISEEASSDFKDNAKITQNTYYLSEIKRNYKLTEEINFYFPDLKDMKIRNVSEKIEFSTNDITEEVFTSAYYDVVKGNVRVLPKNSRINKLDMDMDHTLHIDLSMEFLSGMNVEAMHEGMILQSLTNTFGRFFGTEQVRFTVDDEDYKSSNIKLRQQPMKVDFVRYPLFYDVVVYGGTASGIMAAVSASREGKDVALIEQTSHLGGMVSGGLSYTDHGNIKVIGGMTKEFFELAGRHYSKKISWFYEPHVAELIFKKMLQEENIHVYFNSLLKEKGGVKKDGTSILSIEMLDGLLFYAQNFIDSTYEGDLMAKSSVSYTVGRESNDVYQESFAGVLPPLGRNNFYYNLKAFDKNGTLYEEISTRLPGPAGSGDEIVQSYNYRLCLTNNPNNQVPFSKPENYRRERYLLVAAWLNFLKESEGRSIKFSDIIFFGPLPNNKYDINNSGPFSTDYIGGSYLYPEADYQQREEIRKEHKEYIQGLLYFVTNDEAVPAELRADAKKWGYAGDEFVDNDYWPYQLYIREARRMVGDYVMTERDVRHDKLKFDAIGMGSYNIDSHNVQRYLTLDGYVQNEGELQIPVTPYQIPYRVMMPKISEADNLIVTVCVSASHIAYSSLRMEPQYMIMGEAAGIAASMAIDKDTAVQHVDTEILKKILIENGAILEVPVD